MPEAIFTAPLTGLSGASALNTKSTPVPLNTASQVGGTVTWGSGCSAGQVVFEIAPLSSYGGTWQAVFTSDFQDNGVESFTYPGPFSGFGRWRVSTAVVGGTVSSDTQKFAGQ